MFLENLGIDALDPQRLGRFWEAALGTTALTDAPDIYETRLSIDGDAHLDLLGAAAQEGVAQRLRGLGASDLDIGQGEVPWIVLGDPEGGALCVMEKREAYVGTGPIAALPMDSADPARDAEFWAWLSGWEPATGVAPRTLRHPSGRGPLLELCPEPAEKRPGAKNPIHLDVRLEPEDDADADAAGISAQGGEEFFQDWGELPWRVFCDPSGHEFCVLPAVGAGA